MIKILYIISLFFIVTNCSMKKVVKHHGVPFLEKKQQSLIVNKTNKNDIRKILGNPSTTNKPMPPNKKTPQISTVILFSESFSTIKFKYISSNKG